MQQIVRVFARLFRSKLKHAVKKYKFFLLFIVSSFVICSTILCVELWKLSKVLELKSYEDYICLKYMPARKQATGQWPTDLSGLEVYIKQEESKTQAYYVKQRLQRVLNIYHARYKGFKPIQISGEKMVFRVILAGETIDCEAHIKDTLLDSQ